MTPQRTRAFALGLASLVAACAEEDKDVFGGFGPLPDALAQSHPIDGVVKWGALTVPKTYALDWKSDLGAGAVVGTTSLRVAFTNDDRELYVALEWDDATWNHEFDNELGPIDFDGVLFQLDVDGDGVYETGEDQRAVIAASVASQYVDGHTIAPESETDDVQDGQGKLAYDDASGLYTCEMRFPFSDDADGLDGDLTADTRFNVVLFDHAEPGAVGGATGNAAGLSGLGGAGADSSAWPKLPLADVGDFLHLDPPDDLTGTIVFISTHDVSNGEIYAFDPQTGATMQVTDEPALWKDNVSLSHDRTRVAFHGSTTPEDPATWEIYAAMLDGTGLAKLTDDAFLNAHPAWSPDDEHIAYGSRRDDPDFSIVVMTALGVELDDLTPPGVDDNDPEYLPDGRLVFKTDRFSGGDDRHIALMDEDGGNLVRLTDVAGGSDHDPTGDGATALFERFPYPGPFYANPDYGFLSWPIVRIGLDGTSEKTLIDDGWLNALPVYDPTGKWFVYLKGQGYNDAHIASRGGEDHGRLIPGQSSIRYVDWK